MKIKYLLYNAIYAIVQEAVLILHKVSVIYVMNEGGEVPVTG
jgi:hypothetical protein